MKFIFSLIALFSALGNSGTLDMTSFAAGLKTLYTDKKIQNMVYLDNPLLALMPKDEAFYGDSKKCPIIYGNPQARSAQIAKAISKVPTANSKLKAFVITRVSDYSLAQIQNEVIKASQNDAGAFLRAAKVEIDGAMNSIVRSLAIALYRNGSGSIGRIANSDLDLPVLTLRQADDITNFEVGANYVVSSTDGTGSVRVGVGTSIAVDRIAGTVTFSDDLDAIFTSPAQDDYIFMEGDYGLKLSGLAAWLPYGGASATSFFGVDRTADVTRLGGVWMDGTTKPIEEAFNAIMSLIAREGGKPDYCFLNYSNYANLENALGTRVVYCDVSPDDMPEIGFRGIKINGPRGPVQVIPDQNCPVNYAYFLDLSTWELSSLGKAPQLFNTDGLDWLRNSMTDTLDIRIYYYAQLGCMAPGFNGVLKLS